MRWIQHFDLFLLDMDGLLVDTERLHFQAYQTLCSENNQQLPWDFPAYLGVAHSSHDGLQKALLPLLGGVDWAPFYERKKAIYQKLLIGGKLELLPGVAKLIEELSTTGKKRCVVTHSSKDQVDAIKDALPALKSIPVWITREDYDQPKPAPDGYAKAFEVLADPGDRVVGFEDSLRGLQSLKGTLAMPVLICDPSHPQMKSSELEGVHHFTSFTKIPNTFNHS